MIRLVTAAALLVLPVACDCSSPEPGGRGGGSSAGGNGGASGAGGGAGGPVAFSDFPSTPILDGVAAPFAADAGTAAEPCITEPEDGTLYPFDWLRPRFSFVAANGEDLFELTLRAPNQVNPLIVYTSSSSWTMPKAMWLALAEHSSDRNLTLDVRAAVRATGVMSVAARSWFRVAKASAAGAIVYWTTSNGTALKGFKVGDERVTTVLVPAKVPGSQCIGCHSSTPDGVFVGFSSSTQAGTGATSGIALASVDGGASPPAFVSAAAAQLLVRQAQQTPVFSPAHWVSGDRLVVSNFEATAGHWELIWTDLEATSTALGTGWGVISRDSDTGKPATPAFSHDGKTLAYASASAVLSGVITGGTSDLFTVPFRNRAGGAATAVPAASSPASNECYPSFSPDDALLAFARVPAGESNYNNANAEVYVAPWATAAMAHRLRANDAPACLKLASPGLTNSWPKWGPQSSYLGGKTYYWLTFSSTRIGKKPQLFVAPVVVEGATVTSYPALHLWNQPADEANHTPTWDLFQLVLEPN